MEWVNARGDGAAAFNAGQPTSPPAGPYRAVGKPGRRVCRDERLKARGATTPGRAGPSRRRHASALRLAGIVSVALLLCVSCRQLPRQHSAPLAGELNEAIVPLARAALDAGQVETAKRLYGRLLEVDPGSAVARMGLGDTALREGASNRAIRWYREAIAYARAPGEARAATLAHARAALAAGDIETAARSFGELAKDEDETVEAAWGFNGVGLTRLLQDDLRGAVTAMQEAVRRDPDEVRFRENLDRAMAMYRQAEREGLLPDLPDDPVDGEASEAADRTADPAALAAEQPYTDLDSAMTAVKDMEPEAGARVAQDDAAPAAPEPSDVPMAETPGAHEDRPTTTEGLDAVALDPPSTDASETTGRDTDSADGVPGAEPPAEPAALAAAPALADAPEQPDGEADEAGDDAPSVEPTSEDEAPALADALEPADGDADEAGEDAPSVEPASEDEAPALADVPEPPDGETDEPREDAPSVEPASEDETPSLADAPVPSDGEADEAGEDAPSVEPASEDETPSLADAPVPSDGEADEPREDVPSEEPASGDDAPSLADAPEPPDGEADDAGDDVPSEEPASEDDAPSLAGAPEPADGTADEPRDDASGVEPASEDEAPSLADAPVPPDGEADEAGDDVPGVEPASEDDAPALAGTPELADGDAVETDDVLAVDLLVEDAPALTDAPEPPMADDTPALEFPDAGSEGEELDTADRVVAGQDAESVRDADLGANATFNPPDPPDSPESRGPTPPDAPPSDGHQAAVEPSDASTDGADGPLPDAPGADVGDLQLAADLATSVATGSDTAAGVGDLGADAEPAATVESADAPPDVAPTDGDRTMRVWRGDSLFIEVGAHAGRAEADRSADELLDRIGRRPQVVAVSSVDGDTWFQMNVGPFETPADAAAVVGKVDSAGYDAWTYSVDPAPSRPEFYVARDADVFWLQAGAYGSMERAMFIASVIGRIADMPVTVSETVVADGGVVYRVRLGPIGSRRELAILGETFEEGGLAPIEIPTER